MTRTIHCPQCRVELTIPSEAGSKRLRCPKCSTRFYPDGRMGSGPSSSMLATRPGVVKSRKLYSIYLFQSIT